ncbi:MAG: hypothetical protein IKD06_01075 [Clostridia bacterium]|nr:hypothetical protein [Clostridia bacterium]
MKSLELFRQMENIKDEYILQAAEADLSRKKQKPFYIKMLTAAACAALVLFSALTFANTQQLDIYVNGTAVTKQGTVAQISQPAALSHERSAQVISVPVCIHASSAQVTVLQGEVLVYSEKNGEELLRGKQVGVQRNEWVLWLLEAEQAEQAEMTVSGGGKTYLLKLFYDNDSLSWNINGQRID